MIFHDQQYFKYCKLERNVQDQSKYPPMLPYLEHLQATNPSYVTMTTPLSSKIGENFYEGMK